MRFNKYLILIFLITLIGFSIRSYKLTTSPEGLYIDETSIGYNAYSIIKTGHDEHGKFMPLFFEAFGEYKLPVYVYSVVFVQLFIGPSDLSVRLPAVIFGTLTIPLLFLFSKELLKNNPSLFIKNLVSPLGAFLLATSPWHFQFSRPGFEASIGLFFLILGLYLFFKGMNNKSSFNICLSLISFVLTLYSYNSARIVTPIIVIILFILYFRHFEIRFWIKIILIPAILIIPFLNFALGAEGLARARQVSVFFQSNVAAGEVFSNYLRNISPLYLFNNGDPTIGHLTPYRMSLIYLVEAPFFLAGLIYLFLKKSKISLFIVFLFFICLIPPSIATLNPHALRGMSALSVTPIISAIGFSYFLNLFKRNHLYLIIILIYASMILISTLSFLNTYHNKYIPSAGWDWQVGIKRTSLRVLQIENNYNDIYFDLDPRKIPLLWYLKIDPSLYQKNLSKSQFGNYHINEAISTSHGLYAGLQPPQGKLLEYVYYPNNSVAYGIWEF